MRAAAALAAAVSLLAAACAPREPYAAVKRRLCEDCRVEKLPFNVPARGAALGFGRKGDPRVSWIVADLDRRALNRLTTAFDIQSNTTDLLTRKEEPLGDERGRRLVALANMVWASDLAMPSEPAGGAVWDLYLFDGAAVRHDAAGGRPAGAAGELERLLEARADAP